MGIKIDKPSSDNGEVSFHLNWRKVEHYQMNWNKFWEHEAHTPEVGEIAEHLNKAAKKSIDDIAAGQIKVVHNIGKLAHAFSHFVEPGNACDS